MRIPLLLPAAAILGALTLVGCSSPTTAPDSEKAVDPADPRPTPLIDLTCDELLAPATLTDAFSADTALVELSFYGSGDYYTLAQLGAEQAGSLRCEWSDRGGAVERYLQVTVLPDASSAWELMRSDLAMYQPRANEFGNPSFSTCSTTNGYSSCRIDALVGDRWVSAILGGLSHADAAATVLSELTASVAAAAPAESSWTPTETPRPSCAELLPLDQLRAALGTEVDEWANPMPTQAIFHGGFLQAGGTVCQWRNSFASASAMTVDAVLLPDGSWAWNDNWATEPHPTVTREPVDGLGDDAYSGCSTKLSGGSDCWVSVLVGGHWLGVLVNDESSDDERVVASDLTILAMDSLNLAKE